MIITKRKFDIVILSHNITGELHIGHVLNLVIQRVFIFWNKSRNVSCLMGMDHAGLATNCILSDHY